MHHRAAVQRYASSVRGAAVPDVLPTACRPSAMQLDCGRSPTTLEAPRGHFFPESGAISYTVGRPVLRAFRNCAGDFMRPRGWRTAPKECARMQPSKRIAATLRNRIRGLSQFIKCRTNERGDFVVGQTTQVGFPHFMLACSVQTHATHAIALQCNSKAPEIM